MFTCVTFIIDSCSYLFALLCDEPEQIIADNNNL